MATAANLTELADALAHLAHSLADQEGSRSEPETARQIPERVLLTAEEAAERLGIGRTLMYRLIRTGEVESIRIGRLRRIPASALHDYAARQLAA